MAKNCLIFETLNGVNEMHAQKNTSGMMTLSGIFGVCGVKNNNHRIYETTNYSKMVSEMQKRIQQEGGIPGELEHPQNMNITLENVSHKITDINIDANGVVTGTITLLDTPKGKIAQALVEGGLPLFISSRATGSVDKNTGNVTLERIATYDLVGSPGFSQAKLKLNENQIVESINESIFYITEKESNEKNNMEENLNHQFDEILEKIEFLEETIEDLQEENRKLKNILSSKPDFDLEELAEGVQRWIIEEYSPVLEEWVTNNSNDNESLSRDTEENITRDIKDWIKEEYSPILEEWLINEYSQSVEDWISEEYSPTVEKWLADEYSLAVEKWITEEYSRGLQDWLEGEYTEKINSSIEESKKTSLSDIDSILKMFENLDTTTKPTYNTKKTTILNEDFDPTEPLFIANMPDYIRVKWDMASSEIKESITRRAKLYDFSTQNAIDKFWESVSFENIKPINKIYEGLENVEDERERNIRLKLRASRFRK